MTFDHRVVGSDYCSIVSSKPRRDFAEKLEMVGATGIEPVTPPV